jgi:hypothetical protein
LFAVDVPPGLSVFITATLRSLGGAKSAASIILGSVQFYVNNALQSVVSEPGSFVLAGTGLLLLAARTVNYKKSVLEN